MATFEQQYEELIIDIISNGVSNEGKKVRTVWKDGEPAYTKALWGRMFRIKPEDGFPILRKKYVRPKSLIAEILWIMQKASNVVSDARELGTGVWNEWEKGDGTIKKAYGYQIQNNSYKVDYATISDGAKKVIGKTFGTDTKADYKLETGEDGKEYVYLNQMDYVLQQLKDNPYSRQTLTMLWNPKDTHDMALPPCVLYAHWEIMSDDKLYLSVHARSSDVFLGLPFNVSQYAVLHRLVASVVGVEIGDFVFTMDDVHLYDRHIEKALEYIKNEPGPRPVFWLDGKVEKFTEFKFDKNFKILGYKEENYAKINAPIAVGVGELEEDKKEEELIEVEETEKVPYEVCYELVSTLELGVEELVTKGQEGEERVIYEVRKKNGKEVSREEVSRKTIKKPVEEHIRVGG